MKYEGANLTHEVLLRCPREYQLIAAQRAANHQVIVNLELATQVPQAKVTLWKPLLTKVFGQPNALAANPRPQPTAAG